MNGLKELANQASKEWMKEYPTPEETANQVPKRYLEIFAKLVAAKEREACATVCEAQEDKGGEWDVQQQCANAIRART
jgi:DNA phosphorothioation-dependent restriction protein DptG